MRRKVKKKNKTTIGFGFLLHVLTAVFLILLMITTISGLAPVTETRIADCESRIETLNGDLEYAQNSGAEQEKIDDITEKIGTYEDRIEMLKGRERLYAVAMIFLVCFVLFGAVLQSAKSRAFVKTSSFGLKEETYNYFPMFGAPLCAVSILLAIGISYRVIFRLTAMDLVMLVAALVVGVVAFLVYRRMPYLSAKTQKTYLSLKHRLTVSDALFFLPAILIFLLLASLFLFGVTINGSKLWLNFFGIQLQPGEFIKVLLAMLFASAYGKLWRATVAVVTGGVAILGMLLLRDMGTAIIIFAMIVIMLLLLLDNKMTFPLYDHKKFLVITLLLSVCAFVFALSLFPYARERFSGLGSAMEQNGQQAAILKALIFGGIGGLGLQNSSYIINIYAIDNDMALAGMTSIFGYGMLLIVLLCYALLIIIPVRKTAVYREFYFMAAQISVVLFMQVMFNALGSVDVLPFTGIVAPFISSGGSALISFSAMAGILLATLHPTIKPLEVEKQ